MNFSPNKVPARPQTVDGTRAAKQVASAKRTQIAISLAYLYDSTVLLGFFAAGFVPIGVPIAIFALLGASSATVYLAHASGWSSRQSDPTLFLPQHVYAIVVVLGLAVVAPQIGFQPVSTLLAITAFSFLAPSQKSVIISWGVAALGAVAVVFIAGSRLAMPTATPAGQFLTAAVIVGLLARCIWIANSFRRLQRRIGEKNDALRVALARIEALASRDDLTGLPNRRSITEWFAEQIAISRRTNAPLCVAFLDLDHFKQVNDTFGHWAGDRALQLFAKLALGVIREGDRLGRHGGEEFLLVMTGTRLTEASEPLERIRRHVAALDWSVIGAGLRLTITIGATQWIPGETAEDTIGRADSALYLGKESGRDQVVVSALPAQSTTASFAMRSA